MIWHISSWCNAGSGSWGEDWTFGG